MRLCREAVSRHAILFPLVLCALALPDAMSAATADAARDSIPQYRMNEMVVTADRVANPAAGTTSAVSVMKSAEMRSLPLQKLSDVLQMFPGFLVADRDGLGRDPVITSRGFYGGGEAEYILVLLDGTPVNDLESGLVSWSLVPLGGMESVEAVRGSSSALYGDAALGGVINIRTNASDTARSMLSVGGGSFGIFDAAGVVRGNIGRNRYQLYASREQSEGFRAHSEWEGTSFGGDLTVLSRERSRLWISATSQVTTTEVPGPLTVEELSRDRGASSVYYRADGRDEQRHQGHIGFSARATPRMEFTADVLYKYREAELVRTFANSVPIVDFETYEIVGFYDTSLFGDTKGRDLRGNEAGARLKYTLMDDAGLIPYRVVVGFDGDYGSLKSDYHRYASGFEEDYRGDVPERGEAVVSGTSSRTKYALYVGNELQLSPLSLTLGLRYDAIDDDYEGTLPDTGFGATNSSWSPKLGVNVRLSDRDDYSGTIYANVNRSFKAPTLDQLTDQRPIDYAGFARIPTGPDSYRYSLFYSQSPPYSNALLKPQTALSFEVGTYQRLRLARDIFCEASAAVYRIDMDDEIDFDFATFRYQNVQESRHEGVESSLRLYWMPRLTAFANYTWTSVRFASGPYEDHYLQGIPRHVASCGATYEHGIGFKASIVWNFMSDMYLDDENTVGLPNVNVVGARIAQKLRTALLFFDVANVFDEEYSSNGYMLDQTVYLYPGGGRAVRGGVTMDF